jgi:L-ascorbate metabolism protein UlaG (beta-lactamase superfamily)
MDMARILYQGHASLRLETSEGKFVYIDPFAGEGYDKPADLVLITHEHYDHNAIDRVPLNERTIVIRAKDALSNGVYYDFEYFGIKIQATPASNSHHDVNECVGFLLEVEDKKIYVAGDTDYVPYMEELGKLGIDYAFLPIDGIYNMGPEEATRCANIIKPKHLIPYHMHPGMLFDIKQDMKVSYENCLLVRPGAVVNI